MVESTVAQEKVVLLCKGMQGLSIHSKGSGSLDAHCHRAIPRHMMVSCLTGNTISGDLGM